MVVIQTWHQQQADCRVCEDEPDNQLAEVNLNLNFKFFFRQACHLIFFNLASGTNGIGNEKNSLTVGTPGKAFTTDTEEDETVDFLLKSTMAIPKGQPPKKRTKKYGERKSCKKLEIKHQLIS